MFSIISTFYQWDVVGEWSYLAAPVSLDQLSLPLRYTTSVENKVKH
jgi:hypothetical protein